MKNEISDEIRQKRMPTYNIHPLILSRWSPRSMTGEDISAEMQEREIPSDRKPLKQIVMEGKFRK